MGLEIRTSTRFSQKSCICKGHRSRCRPLHTHRFLLSRGMETSFHALGAKRNVHPFVNAYTYAWDFVSLAWLGTGDWPSGETGARGSGICRRLSRSSGTCALIQVQQGHTSVWWVVCPHQQVPGEVGRLLLTDWLRTFVGTRFGIPDKFGVGWSSFEVAGHAETIGQVSVTNLAGFEKKKPQLNRSNSSQRQSTMPGGQI